MDFAFPSKEVRANWFFGTLLEHQFETCTNMPIGFPSDSMCTRIWLIAFCISYRISPIAPNGQVYAQVKVLCRNRATVVAQAHGAYLAWSSVITYYFLKVIGFIDDNQLDIWNARCVTNQLRIHIVGCRRHTADLPLKLPNLPRSEMWILMINIRIW